MKKKNRRDAQKRLKKKRMRNKQTDLKVAVEISRRLLSIAAAVRL